MLFYLVLKRLYTVPAAQGLKLYIHVNITFILFKKKPEQYYLIWGLFLGLNTI